MAFLMEFPPVAPVGGGHLSAESVPISTFPSRIFHLHTARFLSKRSPTLIGL